MSQTVPIDRACIGKPFTFSFWMELVSTFIFPSSGTLEYIFDGASSGAGVVGLANGQTTDVFLLQSFAGIVPDGAPAFTITINASVIYFDVFDFTICA
jgi:hypothetical protein